MITTSDQQIFFGMREPKPVTNIPPGSRLRLRLRANDFPSAVTRSASGAAAWIVLDCGDHWELDGPIAQNIRA